MIARRVARRLAQKGGRKPPSGEPDAASRFLRLFNSKSRVLCVISGPSGAGKTTLLGELSKQFKGVVFKDLDDFDDDAVKLLKLPEKTSDEWSDDMEKHLADKRQELMDTFLSHAQVPVVLGGIPFEDEFELRFPEEAELFLLDVDAHTAALRAYHRSQHEEPKFRRLRVEIPKDEAQAAEDIRRLKAAGYRLASKDEITAYIQRQLHI